MHLCFVGSYFRITSSLFFYFLFLLTIETNTLFGTVRCFAISTYVNHSDIKRALLLFLFKRISMSSIYVRVQLTGCSFSRNVRYIYADIKADSTNNGPFFHVALLSFYGTFFCRSMPVWQSDS